MMGAEGMAPDPEDVIVTTGGQQAIDLIAKTLVDPGDPVICEAPTYPGRRPGVQLLPGGDPPDRDGRRGDEGGRARGACSTGSRAMGGGRSSSTRCRPSRTRPGSPSPASAGGAWSSSPASARCWWSRTTRMACSATRASRSRRCTSLDGGDYVIYIGTLSKILSPGIRLGWAVAPPPVMDEDRRSASRRPTSARRPWPSTSRSSTSPRTAGAPTSTACATSIGRGGTRCSRRWRATSPSRRPGPGPSGGMFVWATLPSYIDTSDLLAKALRENVAFVPGAAAYVDGQSGTNSMRLNFSGSDEDEIREGDSPDRQGGGRAGRPVPDDHRRAQAAGRAARRLHVRHSGPPSQGPVTSCRFDDARSS